MATIKWSDTEELRIGQSEYKGKKYFSVRLWWTTPTGEMAPGKQGINIPEARLPEVLLAFNEEAATMLGTALAASSANAKSKRGKA